VKDSILKRTTASAALSLLTAFHFITYSQTRSDTLQLKTPKHYFQTVIFLDSYRKPNQQIVDSTNFIDSRLKSYGIRQAQIGFYTPIKTNQYINSDSSTYNNTHYLLTGHLLSLRPQFNGLTQHNLVKFGLGLRIIHNTGKKGLWFIDIAPFFTKDVTFKDRNGYLRMANSFIYSHNFSEKFNLRVGLTKSFLWGNRNYLPYIGMRIGKLDGVHFSLQITRNMSLNVPINDKHRLSLFTRPQGGMFTFSNKDSVYYFNREADFFNFTRYELLSGLRYDAAFGKIFAMYISLGLSTRNNITFYSESANANRPRAPYKTFFYMKNFGPTGFLNIGLVFRFGETKHYHNIHSVYDAMDLNNTQGIGNSPPGSPLNIPVHENIKKSKLNLADVQDLIDVNEF
jgi:hypothetical protein